MKFRTFFGYALLAGAVLSSSASSAFAQSAAPQAKPSASYQIQREFNLVGTVVEYKATSDHAPSGGHVRLLTPSGIVEVQAGDPRFLAAKGFHIEAGQSMRVVGEYASNRQGVQFVARIIQQGTQALEVRSVAGFPYSYAAPRDSQATKNQGGVL